MNAPGMMREPSGCCQRTSASPAAGEPVASSTCGCMYSLKAPLSIADIALAISCESAYQRADISGA